MYFKDTLIIKIHQYPWFKYSRTGPGDTLHTGDTQLMTAWPCNLLLCLTEWSVSSSAAHLCPYQGAQHRQNQESQGVPGEISLVPVSPMKISSQEHLKKKGTITSGVVFGQIHIIAWGLYPHQLCTHGLKKHRGNVPLQRNISCRMGQPLKAVTRVLLLSQGEGTESWSETSSNWKKTDHVC